VIRYADDFIVTAKSRRLLEEHIIPAVTRFLAARGLALSEEKSQIVYIREGFTFLGQTFRKHGNTLHITPSKEGVLALVRKVGALIREYVGAPIAALIKKLNQTLRGWANYHRHVVASEAFRRVDSYVYEQLWRMLRRRHPDKSKGWLIRQYWLVAGKKWRFSVKQTSKGKTKVYQLLRVSSLGIRRHIKIKADANPYMAEYARYFARRRQHKEAREMRELSARSMRNAKR
jgi:RNA-directed DNA polymerase